MAHKSDEVQLLERARNAARRAYAPYSHFHVGAAVRDASGGVYVGCNVENASYGLTVCAERNAIASAIADGAVRPFRAMAIACADADPAGGPEARSPCGACRQVIAEHLAPDAPVYLDGGANYRVAELLPHAFTL